MKLTKTEEQLMEYIWREKKVFMKDLIDCFDEPKPAPTTVATLLKRMQEKGFVAYKTFGNSRQYYPLVTKASYFSKYVNGIIEQFFDNSPLQFASFFTQSGKLSKKELESLKNIIDEQIKKKKS
ncbi:penicillinase repressor [Arachidicoccus ginsenosidimutans]|uniref:BlaI/MecI/CopY family transcriptional regulator n=1 Tax=Arachidicoccus sp. BS20 TaxID=1850526 RepID=UPI0007F1729F|nr:BlaI/MecI/CopY family transcriptional regulator [Arachidicoccus sp. BS20]ANI89423.1 penicillinase repressor [Arachidicoccus sp. BS20]